VADSTASTGLKWATPSAALPNYTLAASGSLSGGSVSVTGLNLYDTSADQNSLFTQNPEKYGIYKTKEHFYINENWTYSVAHKIAKTVDKSLSKKSKRLGGWVSLGLCNLGYTFDEVISPGFIRQLGKREEIDNRFNEFRDEYIQKICC
jgi:hypothetical protein